jgi:hypothetical protein
MASTHIPARDQQRHAGPQRTPRPRSRSLWLLPVALLSTLLLLAGGGGAYLLWPVWPEAVAIDAPPLPITISGVTFNVPPAAIRAPVQRRPGAQERIDLAFQWPSLDPPAPAAKGATPPAPGERLFVTIARDDGKLPPAERLKTIYPRYLKHAATPGADGLVTQPFGDDTPYRGEDLIYQAAAPERFFARCTRAAGPRPGTCLSERRIGAAELTFRFPRDWLTEWGDISENIERLITQLRLTGG